MPSSSPIPVPNISAHHSPLGCMGIQVHVISQRIGGLFDIAPCPMNMLPAQCTHPTYSSVDCILLHPSLFLHVKPHPCLKHTLFTLLVHPSWLQVYFVNCP